MKSILCLLLLISPILMAGTHVPMKDRSETIQVKIKLEKRSDARRYAEYIRRSVQLRTIADNRNHKEVPISVDIYLIGKNNKSVNKLLMKESASINLEKFKNKLHVKTITYTYDDYYKGARSQTQYEYRGCLVVTKGVDGKIISVEGEYGKFYTFIEGKSVGDTFNSKGEAR